MRYLIQYTPGTGGIVLDALLGYVENVEVRYRDDSAMVFDSNSRADRVASIPFAKNAFVVIAATPRTSIDKGVSQLSRALQTARFPSLPSDTRNFRTMIHVDGELHSVDKGAKTALERAITMRTGGHVEPRGSCREFWVVGRIDLPNLLFCARLPRAKRPPKAKGAVSYELSSMLISASQPDPHDVFLDPFAGSGSFVLARQHLPARQIWYSDTNGSLRADLPREMTNDRRVRFLKEDALALPTISDGSIDVIVTDPPWGEFESVGMPYEEFAHGIARSFDRVLNRLRGRFVLLIARRMAETLAGDLKDAGFIVTATHEILVNGHPASVIIGGRPQDTTRLST